MEYCNVLSTAVWKGFSCVSKISRKANQTTNNNWYWIANLVDWAKYCQILPNTAMLGEQIKISRFHWIKILYFLVWKQKCRISIYKLFDFPSLFSFSNIWLFSAAVLGFARWCASYRRIHTTCWSQDQSKQFILFALKLTLSQDVLCPEPWMNQIRSIEEDKATSRA